MKEDNKIKKNEDNVEYKGHALSVTFFDDSVKKNDNEEGRKNNFKHQLGDIKKIQKKPDGIFGTFMTRTVSHFIAFFAYKVNVTPNLVSFVSFLFSFLSGFVLFFKYDDYYFVISAAVFWWIAAILDAADGDLARYMNQTSPFGKWFDSFLDRLKEFIIFSVLGFAAYKMYSNSIYLLLGLLSIFSNIMSGYISDTKYLFIKNRRPEIVINKKFIFGMVDTRDFILILSFLMYDFRIALFLYGTLFLLVLLVQSIVVIKKYHKI